MSSSHGESERLIVRAPNWIGDAVLATPAIRALRRKFPRARLTVLCRPWVAPIFEHSPDVNDVIALDDKGWRILRAIRAVRAGRYDLGVLFPNSLGSAFVFRAARVPRRIGYARDGRGWLLTDRVECGAAIRKAHMVDYYLNILRGVADVDKADRTLVLQAGAAQRAAIAAMLAERGIGPKDRVFGVNPGAAFGTAKRWLPERYAALAGHLAREYKARVLVTGSASEADETNCTWLTSTVKGPSPSVSKTTVAKTPCPPIGGAGRSKVKTKSINPAAGSTRLVATKRSSKASSGPGAICTPSKRGLSSRTRSWAGS